MQTIYDYEQKTFSRSFRRPCLNRIEHRQYPSKCTPYSRVLLVRRIWSDADHITPYVSPAATLNARYALCSNFNPGKSQFSVKLHLFFHAGFLLLRFLNITHWNMLRPQLCVLLICISCQDSLLPCLVQGFKGTTDVLCLGFIKLCLKDTQGLRTRERQGMGTGGLRRSVWGPFVGIRQKILAKTDNKRDHHSIDNYRDYPQLIQLGRTQFVVLKTAVLPAFLD